MCPILINFKSLVPKALERTFELIGQIFTLAGDGGKSHEHSLHVQLNLILGLTPTQALRTEMLQETG